MVANGQLKICAHRKNHFTLVKGYCYIKELLSITKLTSDLTYSEFAMNNSKRIMLTAMRTKNGDLCQLKPAQNMALFSTRFQASSDTQNMNVSDYLFFFPFFCPKKHVISHLKNN